MTMHYFTSDGTWGDARELTMVDTSEWTPTDWDHVAAARSDNLMQVVHMVMFTRKIANKEKR